MGKASRRRAQDTDISSLTAVRPQPGQEVAPPQVLPFSFLRQIDNQNHVWKLFLVGNEKMVGRVTHYLWTQDGIPITIEITTDDHHRYEVPWCNIQAIELILIDPLLEPIYGKRVVDG